MGVDIRSHCDMTSPIELEEYKAKWEYVRHTESLQAKNVEWYFGIVAAVLTFIYSNRYEALSDLFGGRILPLAVLVPYSLLVTLRLLVQKRNYDTYTARIRNLEGAPVDDRPIGSKVLSVFKLQYYAVALVGTAVVVALLFEVAWAPFYIWLISVAYLLVMIFLSFTRLIGR